MLGYSKKNSYLKKYMLPAPAPGCGECALSLFTVIFVSMIYHKEKKKKEEVVNPG